MAPHLIMKLSGYRHLKEEEHQFCMKGRMMDQPRNFKIEGVELNWVKLETAQQNPFNKNEYQWEMQIATKDKAKAEMLKANHLNVKEKDGKFVVSLKRKTKKSNGEDNGPVRVVDANLVEIANKREIGNGSVGNVIVFQYPWENMGRKGIGNSLTAVQVTELEKYVPDQAAQFSVVGGSEEPAETQDPVSMF